MDLRTRYRRSVLGLGWAPMTIFSLRTERIISSLLWEWWCSWTASLIKESVSFRGQNSEVRKSPLTYDS
jgi:hypothetical protein